MAILGSPGVSFNRLGLTGGKRVVIHSRITSWSTPARSAPRAIRIPTSFVRGALDFGRRGRDRGARRGARGGDGESVFGVLTLFLGRYVTDSTQNWGRFSEPRVDDLFSQQSRSLDPASGIGSSTSFKRSFSKTPITSPVAGGRGAWCTGRR